MKITQGVVLKEEGATLWRWYEVRAEKRFDQPFMKDQRRRHQLVLSSSRPLQNLSSHQGSFIKMELPRRILSQLELQICIG